MPACLCRFAPRQAYLFSALRHARLVPPDADLGWPDLQYSRGGRTDKGVSGERALLVVTRWQSAASAAGSSLDAQAITQAG